MSLKQVALVLVAAIALSQLGLQCARAEPPFEIVLEDELGNRLESFHQRGQTYAMGRMGQRYNVRVINHSARRVEAVVSVDGRDVISGRPGDYQHQRGYLVPAYDSLLIEGFRTSEATIAAFRFTSPGDSYSSRMGTPENVGIIGAAFYPEVQRRIPQRVAPEYEYKGGRGDTPRRRSKSSLGSSGPAPSAPSASMEAEAGSAADSSGRGSVGAYRHYEDDSSNIGTQYGEERYSRSVEVSFTRANPKRPSHVLTLRYDDERGLMARGIVTRPRQRPLPVSGPSAFPVNRFAAPPPDYRSY